MEIQLNFKKVDGNQTNLDGNQTNLDGNWTNLDGIPTNHRKQQFFNFHMLPMKPCFVPLTAWGFVKRYKL